MVAFNPVVVSIPITFHTWSSMHDNFESWFDSSVWGGKRADAQPRCAHAGWYEGLYN